MKKTQEDQEEQRRFLKAYREYAVSVLNPTQHQIRDLFDKWAAPGYWDANRSDTKLPLPSPIEHRWNRLKRPESVVDKIMRKRDVFDEGLTIESVRKMNDAVAGRITVYFLSQLPLLHGAIMREKEVEICPDIPPVAYMDPEVFHRLGLLGVRQETRDTGYSSVHYILRFRDGLKGMRERPWWELQVRTLAEHLWAQLHHVLGYKALKKTNFQVTKTFHVIGQQLSAIDQHFNLLYEEQQRFQVQTTDVSDGALLNAENLPFVLDEVGTSCAQREIDGLLRMLNSRGLATAGLVRKAGTRENVELIRNTFIREEGRAASNFEVVASIAAIAGIRDHAQVKEAIRLQIAFLKAWQEVQVAGKESGGRRKTKTNPKVKSKSKARRNKKT